MSRDSDLGFNPNTGKFLDLEMGTKVNIFNFKSRALSFVTIKNAIKLGCVTFYEGFDDFGHDLKFTNEYVVGV